ncbi:MAG TPA: ARMT1-like domain-containing protein [Candidatus Brocadiia bacterium]|nr:ARMT1-like domain-containing protein [Candidatus Brocadiia bacterium]
MKSRLECLICALSQALRTARQAGASEGVQRKILDELMGILPGSDLNMSPAEISQDAYATVSRLTGVADPFHDAKKRHNAVALALYPRLREIVDSSDNRLETALRLAAAGNIVDLGVLEDDEIAAHLDDALRVTLARDDSADLLAFLEKPRRVLYLLDNAGEVVFDRVLMEELAGHKVQAVVKSAPIINDVTREDAEEAGVAEAAEIIELGCDSIGVNMRRAGTEFRKAFESADVIIAKGQGNYETLDRWDANIYFILRAKCPIVAEELHVKLHEAVLIHSPVYARP